MFLKLSVFAAYDGRFCTEDYDGCLDIICFEEVTCVDRPAPAVGAMCGPCPSGYFGDGEKCTGGLLCLCSKDLKLAQFIVFLHV